jgi:hypothetical protein
MDLLRRLLLLDLISKFLVSLLQLLLIGAIIVFVVAWFRGISPGDLIGKLRSIPQQISGKKPVEQPNFQDFVPTEWTIESTSKVNLDGDAEPEWLLLYRYGQTKFGFGGPIGGVVYDLMPDRVPANLATPMPNRPSAYIPYHLLPRQYGQSYLADREAKAEVYDVQCDQHNELVVLGYGAFNDRPTILSIFQWSGPLEGYRLMTSAYGGALNGDAGIEIDRYKVNDRSGQQVDGPIKDVTVWQRLYEPPYYARSQIAQRTVYEWTPPINNLDPCRPWPYFTPTPPPSPPPPLRPTPTFTPTPTFVRTLRPVTQTLDFAFGPPQGADEPKRDIYPVTFPEQAVLAWYGSDRVVSLSMPTGTSLRDAVDIVAVVRARDDPRLLVPVTWRVTQESTGAVRDTTTWRLTPLNPPDP